MSEQKKPESDQMLFMPIGMCIGLSLGVAIGAAMGNVSVGMCMGLGIGMCIGTAMDAAKKNARHAQDEQDKGEKKK